MRYRDHGCQGTMNGIEDKHMLIEVMGVGGNTEGKRYGE